MERVAMYLRKSRADLEAEARGEGETLTKHRRQLIYVAKKMNLNIVTIREEVVSGERIIDRPEVIKLIDEVEKGLYDSVLVMDVDRLGRGDMIDQGTILRAFKASKTKIITPNKIYDLENEWDEEYTEFEAFMARRELKMITRRMQRGRIQSVKEGNYIGTHPPYGYLIHKTEGERTLVPNPNQAPVVKMIYDWYTHENPRIRMGSNRIANELNRMGFTSYTGRSWTSSAVLNIIKNTVYIGRLQWKKGSRKEWIDVKGKHEPLVCEDQYQRAQNILKGRYHVPYQLVNGITNPLAGLMKCESCGTSMVLRPYTRQQPHLICYNTHCATKSTRFEYVEQRVFHVLKEWLHQYKADWNKRIQSGTSPSNTIVVKKAAIESLERELIELDNQKNRLFDFLERGIYDEETYLERSQNLTERFNMTKDAIAETKKELNNEINRSKAQKNVIPKIEQILELYHQTKDPVDKNNLLKSILKQATYKKVKHQHGDDFILVLYPKIPQ